MKKLSHYLDYFEANIIDADKVNPKISSSTVGWQIDHSLKVLLAVISALEQSDSTSFRKTFNLTRLWVFVTGYIPRGKVKAPKSVQSYEAITPSDLEKQIEKARISLSKLERLPSSAYFQHPLFGPLNKKQTLRFLEVHTHHHLKIIRDILN